MLPKLFIATKAFISFESKVLILKESGTYKDGSNAGTFDVAGGRMEPGQHVEESLLREVREETGLSVTVGKPFFVSEWRPLVRGEQWQVVGIFFECQASTKTVTLSADHDEYRWIAPADYARHGVIKNLESAFAAYLDRN